MRRTSSARLEELKDAGNNTQTGLEKTTGIHGSHNAHPGGLNKVAEAGKEIKEAPKKP